MWYNLFYFFVSVDDAIAANNISDSTFQIGASWQANKNFLVKVKKSMHCYAIFFID